MRWEYTLDCSQKNSQLKIFLVVVTCMYRRCCNSEVTDCQAVAVPCLSSGRLRLYIQVQVYINWKWKQIRWFCTAAAGLVQR